MLLTLLLTAAVAATTAPRFDAIQMMKLKRLADPQLSPDGKWVAYQATDVALDAGTRNTDIWVVSSDGADGTPPADRSRRRRHPPALEPRRPPHRVRLRARRRVPGLRRPRRGRRSRRR